MRIRTLVRGVLALIVLWLGCRTSGGEHAGGMKWALFLMLQSIPLLFLSFMVAEEARRHLRVFSPLSSDCPRFFRRHEAIV